MRIVIATLLFAVSVAVMAADAGTPLQSANIDLSDRASLQRGAKLFINYCLSCHSAKYMRYSRMGADLGLTDDQVKDNLLLATDKIGDTMDVVMSAEDGKKWFGVAPPDLSVISRARGVDYIYTYLKTFYIDEQRPFGVNNAVFPDVGMPHVLWELQGMQKALLEVEENADGNQKSIISGYEIVQSGSMDEQQYDQAARDLTAFIAYTGEPIQLERKQIGIWVLLFLTILLVISYALKREYWKDVH